jgi:hypothetical protein
MLSSESRCGTLEFAISAQLWPKSHRMSGLIATQCAGEIVLDFLLCIAAVLIAELHADAGSALALRAFRRHPNHTAGDRQFLFLAHQVQQHEHLVSETVVAVGWNEQAAVFDEGHVSEIQRALILDSERQKTRFVTWTSQFLPFPQLLSQRLSTAEQQGFESQL